MKKLTLIFVTIFIVVLASCTSKSDMLVGKWKVVKYEVPQLPKLIAKELKAAPDSIRDQYEEMLYQKADKMKTEVLKSMFEFTKDGAFNIITDGYTQRGTWSLSKDAKMLYSKDSTATFTDTFYVTKLDKKQLEFKITNEEKIESIFGLEKIK